MNSTRRRFLPWLLSPLTAFVPSKAKAATIEMPARMGMSSLGTVMPEWATSRVGEWERWPDTMEGSRTRIWYSHNSGLSLGFRAGRGVYGEALHRLRTDIEHILLNNDREYALYCAYCWNDECPGTVTVPPLKTDGPIGYRVGDYERIGDDLCWYGGRMARHFRYIHHPHGHIHWFTAEGEFASRVENIEQFLQRDPYCPVDGEIHRRSWATGALAFRGNIVVASRVE